MTAISQATGAALGYPAVRNFPKVQYAKIKQIIDAINAFATSIATTTATIVNATISGILSITKGTVTQASTISTAVVLNKQSGTITTVSSTLAHDTAATFTLTNSYITASSVIVVSGYTSGTGVLVASVVSRTAGSAVIQVMNAGTTAAFNNTLVVDFVVLP